MAKKLKGHSGTHKTLADPEAARNVLATFVAAPMVATSKPIEDQSTLAARRRCINP